MSFPSGLLNEFEAAYRSYFEEKLTPPHQLHEAMKYSLLSGGKRIRPRFALESADLVSLPRAAAMKFAIAIEIAHTFSLVHDDLPCLDNDDFRRGTPTTHRKFGEAQGLLAGDALLNLSYDCFFELGTEVEKEAFHRAFQFFNRSIHGMILGQSEELISTMDSLESLEKVQQLKTGMLFRASILIPLLLKGIHESSASFKECDEYAAAFGFAFQVADDLEDESQDQIQESKNILSMLGREKAIRMARERLNLHSISNRYSATEVLLGRLR